MAIKERLQKIIKNRVIIDNEIHKDILHKLRDRDVI